MTWKDIKLATLQKMFAADGSDIPVDESTNDYLASMPYAANEALQRLSTAGKFITKPLVIAHNPLNNMLGDDASSKVVNFSSDYVITIYGAKSYYFEFSGKANLKIEVNGTLQDLLGIDLDSKGTYDTYRGLINATEKTDLVKLIFTTDYNCSLMNFAMYDAKFDDESEIPPYANLIKYNLKEIAPDFYNMAENQIFYEGTIRPYYLQTTYYYRESDNVLLLDRNMPGRYTVYYHAYPPEITIGTDDNFELPLDREVAILMPLYMASQLYKDDDISIATIYRNEFETALESLRDTSDSQGYEKFTSESGW